MLKKMLWSYETKFNILANMQTAICSGKLTPHKTVNISPFKAWGWWNPAAGVRFFSRDREAIHRVKVSWEGRFENENLLDTTKDLRLEQRFTIQLENYANQTASQTSVWWFYSFRKSSRASTASMNDAYEKQEDEDTGRGFSQSHGREELLPDGICSNDNSSSGAAEGTASSKVCNPEDEARGLDDTLLEFQEFRETQIQLERCLQTFRTNYYQDHTVIMQALEEEISRQDDLTKELANFIELYHNEALSLREELGSTKETIRYQFQEVTKELHEALEALQSRVLELEKQPQQMDVQRPQETMLGRMLRFPLVIWSGVLTVVSTTGDFLMSLKPSVPILFAVLTAAVLPVILKDGFTRCNFLSPH